MALLIMLAGLFTLQSCSSKEKEDDQLFTALENEILTLINQHRAGLTLPALQQATLITTEARKHSKNMADGTVPYGHDGMSDRLNLIDQSLPWTSAAENIGAGTGVAPEIFDSWLVSPAHKSNIEGDYDKTGIGAAKSTEGIYYYTHIFIKQ